MPSPDDPTPPFNHDPLHDPVREQAVGGHPVTPEPVGATDAALRRGPEPAVLYTIIGLLIALLLLVVYLLGRGDDDDVAVVLETVTPTPTPTQTEVVLVPPTESEEAPEPDVTETEPVVPPSDPATQPATPTPTPEPTATPADTAPPLIPDVTGQGSDQPEDPGELVAEDGRSMFPVDDAVVKEFVGQQMLGSQVLIESVVDDVGFWVGNSPENRVFVIYDGSIPDFTPVAGERVDFSAPMMANPDDVKLSDEQGGEQFQRQGASIALET